MRSAWRVTQPSVPPREGVFSFPELLTRGRTPRVGVLKLPSIQQRRYVRRAYLEGRRRASEIVVQLGGNGTMCCRKVSFQYTWVSSESAAGKLVILSKQPESLPVFS